MRPRSTARTGRARPRGTRCGNLAMPGLWGGLRGAATRTDNDVRSPTFTGQSAPTMAQKRRYERRSARTPRRFTGNVIDEAPSRPRWAPRTPVHAPVRPLSGGAASRKLARRIMTPFHAATAALIALGSGVLAMGARRTLALLRLRQVTPHAGPWRVLLYLDHRLHRRLHRHRGRGADRLAGSGGGADAASSSSAVAFSFTWPRAPASAPCRRW